jgi:hypothetical protein
VQLVKRDRELEKELGSFTFADVVKELEKPGRDPRETFVPFSFRQDIHTLNDLEPGMVCPGIVTNVTNFGAFVDIGVHQDGLVHISQLADRFVKDPGEVVSPNDRVSVRVLEVCTGPLVPGSPIARATVPSPNLRKLRVGEYVLAFICMSESSTRVDRAPVAGSNCSTIGCAIELLSSLFLATRILPSSVTSESSEGPSGSGPTRHDPRS